MFLSNRRRSGLTLILLLCCSASCGWTTARPDSSARSTRLYEHELPFSTSEPQRYAAEIVITAGSVRRIDRVARNQQQRRFDFGLGDKDQLSVISGPKSVKMLPARKVYCESAQPATGDPAADDLITLRMLHDRRYTEFEDLGTENGLAKYSARVDGGESTKVLLYVDPTIGMPVKQEFYSLQDNSEDLVYTMELRNFQSDPPADLFTVPADYKEVSASAFQSILRSR